MSESAGKTFRGLQEAYASIYANKSENLTEDTIVSEVQEEQEFEINEEKLLITMIEYLVVEGYVKTEEQALKLIPHISEGWMNSIVSHIYISECFHSCVDSLIEEGYDLSSYTEQELYEVYIQESAQDLHEALPLALPLLANPATWAAGAGLVAGTVYAGKKAWDAWRQRRSGWNQSAMDNIQWRDSSKPKPVAPVAAKPKPTTVLRSQGGVNLDTPGGSSVYPGTGHERGDVNLGSTSAKDRIAGQSGGGGGGGDNGNKKEPEPPKDKKPGPVGKALDALNQWATKVKQPKPPKPPGQGMSPTQQKLLNIGKRIFVKDPGESLGKGLLKRYVYGGLGGGLGIDQALGGRTTSRAIELGKTLYHRANIGATDDKESIERRGDEDRYQITKDYEERKKRDAERAAELERIRNGSSSSAPPVQPAKPSQRNPYGL